MDYEKHLVTEKRNPKKGDTIQFKRGGHEWAGKVDGKVVTVGASRSYVVVITKDLHHDWKQRFSTNLTKTAVKKSELTREQPFITEGAGGFNVGDKVKITAIVKGLTGKTGIIQSIDGSYIYVLPKGRKKGEVIELYPNEIKKV